MNVRIGQWKLYHENGEIMQEGNYINVKKKGEWKFYNNKGKLEKIQLYKY